jgi:hypothetical protein
MRYLSLLMILGGMYSLFAASVYLRKRRDVSVASSRHQLTWAAFVYGYMGITATLSGLVVLIRLPYLYICGAAVGVGLAIMLFSTVPCSLSFFNKKYIRPLRDIAFIVSGGYMFWLGAEPLLVLWMS